MTPDVRPVLIVESDPASAELDWRALRRTGFSPMIAGSLREAKALLRQGWFQVMLLDHRMPGVDARELASIARDMTPRVPVILAAPLNTDVMAAGTDLPDVAESIRRTDDFQARLIGAMERAARQGRADHELRRNDSLFRTIADNASDPILLLNGNGTIQWGSAAVIRLLTGGKCELLNQPFIAFVHPDDRGAGDSIYSKKLFRCRGASGDYVLFEPTFSRLGESGDLLGVLRDVTDRMLMQDRVRHQQRLEAMGELTGGLAHDFNNLLAVMIGNLDYLREMLKENPRARACADDALEAGLLGAGLTRRLLAFSRRQPLLPDVTSLNTAIESIIWLLDRTLGRHIKIELDLAPDVWPVFIDRVQLETAIASLATNARDAMPKGGRLLIATRNEHVDEGDSAGRYAVIEVSDTGTGIPPEILGSLFDSHLETGVGLSVVFGFVKQAGGRISVQSESGKGTAFRLCFPRHEQEEKPDRHTPLVFGADAGAATILVVEDNARLRQLTVKQLRGAGYRVLEAARGHDAMEIVDGPAPVDLLFTDIAIPGKVNGHELVLRALAARPGLRAVLTSAFPGVHGPAVDAGWPLLRKPYRQEALFKAVRDALEAKV